MEGQTHEQSEAAAVSEIAAQILDQQAAPANGETPPEESPESAAAASGEAASESEPLPDFPPEPKPAAVKRPQRERFMARVAAGDESVQRAKFTPLASEPGEEALGKIDYLRDVDLEASVELGNAVLTVDNILHLQTGSLVELQQTVGDPVRLLINGNPYALGEVVVIGDKFGVRLTKLLQAS
ncbi:MAG: FliM/FliN family flagellar motor switch protein [candidate division FCPU426 bacterium]